MKKSKKHRNRVDPLIQLAEKRQKESMEYKNELDRKGVTKDDLTLEEKRMSREYIKREEEARREREDMFRTMQRRYRD